MQSRAFSDISTNIAKKTPVLALYANKKGALMGCPGDAKPDDIVKLYDWVCIIYLDKLKLNLK